MIESTERAGEIRRELLGSGAASVGAFSTVEIRIALRNHITPGDEIIIAGDLWYDNSEIPSEIPSNEKYCPRQCMSFSASMALNSKWSSSTDTFSTDTISHIYAVVDGIDVGKGAFWESLLLAKQHNLDNLTVIVNCCEDSDGTHENSNLPLHRTALRQIVMHSGWAVCEENGHDIPHLISALQWTLSLSTPSMIIARTIKGYGLDNTI